MNDMTLPANTDEPEQAKAPVIEAYKGFNLDLTCRSFQYEIGKSYSMSGKIEACSRGFHACEHPLDVLNYYPPNKSRFALVELGGQTAREENSDTKIASAEISIKFELTLPDLIKRAVHWVAERAKAQGNGQYAAGDYGHASSAGDYGHASSAGYRGHASSAGDYGHASSAGYRGHASVKGQNAIAASLGASGTAKAEANGAIMLAAYDDDGKLVAVFSSLVGSNGVEAGKVYRLSVDGSIEQVEEPSND